MIDIKPRRRRRGPDPTEELAVALVDFRHVLADTLGGKEEPHPVSAESEAESQAGQAARSLANPTDQPPPPTIGPGEAAALALQSLTGIGGFSRSLGQASAALATATGIPAVVEALRAIIQALQSIGPYLDEIFVVSSALKPQIIEATRRIANHRWPQGREPLTQTTEFGGPTPEYDPTETQTPIVRSLPGSGG